AERGRHALSKTRVAALQMVSAPEVAPNLEAAGRLIAAAAAAGARLVALPENFYLIGRQDTDKLRAREPDGAGPIQDFLARTARYEQDSVARVVRRHVRVCELHGAVRRRRVGLAAGGGGHLEPGAGECVDAGRDGRGWPEELRLEQDSRSVERDCCVAARRR